MREFEACFSRALGNHKWAKHRIKSGFRERLGDISQCPVCSVEFFTRARLAKHLNELRVRSRNRSVYCQVVFFALDLPLVDPQLLEVLEARDATTAQEARRNGHRQVLSVAPALANAPHILKGLSATRESVRPTKFRRTADK